MKLANGRMRARLNRQEDTSGSTSSLRFVDPAPERGRPGRVCGHDRLTVDGVVEIVPVLSVRVATLQAHHRELADVVRQLRGERSRLRSDIERDLHDGVQNELVSLLVRLERAKRDPDVPAELARTFAALADHASAALASVREIAHGIYPVTLAKQGVIEAMRSCAVRASIDVRVSGPVPRGSEDAEVAIYFSCSEAIQNVHKHTGRAPRASLSLHHHGGVLTARIVDDGLGFNPERTPHGAGLRNIHDRVHALGGTVKLDSGPGRGTALTTGSPWG